MVAKAVVLFEEYMQVVWSPRHGPALTNSQPYATQGYKVGALQYNMLIHAAAKSGHSRQYAIDLYERMRNDATIVPTPYTFSSVMVACARLGNLDMALQVLASMSAHPIDDKVLLQVCR